MLRLLTPLDKRYPLFWVRSNNFGDALNPYLYHAITGEAPQWSDSESDEKIVACGSVAHAALPYDIVWGTGCNPDIELKCDESTRIMMVRGPLSAEMFYEHGIEDITENYGDPALLLPRYLQTDMRKRHAGGIVPHYIDDSLVVGMKPQAISRPLLSIVADTETFVSSITSCEYILSSALHGIICAEAYGIPAVWVEFSDNVAGHGFKFRDYYLGTGRIPPEPLDLRDGIDQFAMSDIVDIIKDWEPPTYDPELMLSLCPFTWGTTDYKLWDNIRGSWGGRYQEIVYMIDAYARIIEFGAGNQRLRDMIPDTCKYTPSDIYKRTEDTVVCDLNTNILPDLSPYDTVVMAGVIEYIHNPGELLEYLIHSPSIQAIILTNHYNVSKEQAEANDWYNTIEYSCFSRMLLDAGFICTKDIVHSTGEIISRFDRKILTGSDDTRCP